MDDKTVYLSLGSNLGNRAENLRSAMDELPHAGVAIARVSSFCETEPVDLLEQPWFLNCVVEAETQFDPFMLLRALREIEMKIGSKKLVAKGPRLIDMDILLYGADTIDTPELQVPRAPLLVESSWVASAGSMQEQAVERDGFRLENIEFNLRELPFLDFAPAVHTGLDFLGFAAVQSVQELVGVVVRSSLAIAGTRQASDAVAPQEF